MSAYRPQLPRSMTSLLEDARCDWTVVPKKRHCQLVIAGTVVLTFPRTHWKEAEGRRGQNALACVRRHLRQIGCAQ